LLAALQIFCPGEKRSLRRYTETAAVATLDTEEQQPGWHLVETAGGRELLWVMAGVEGLSLTADGRGFPQERARYVLAVVQPVDGQLEQGLSEDSSKQPAQKGEENHGYTADQTG
jgi:hypothetical protein